MLCCARPVCCCVTCTTARPRGSQSALLSCCRLRRLVLRHCWTTSPQLFVRLRTACPLLGELTVDECDMARRAQIKPLLLLLPLTMGESVTNTKVQCGAGLQVAIHSMMAETCRHPYCEISPPVCPLSS